MLARVQHFFKMRFTYDARPWFCFTLGLYAISTLHHSIVGEVSGLMLVGTSLAIFYMRYSPRFDHLRVEARAKHMNN